MTEYKNVVVVDEHDQVIGSLPLLEAKAKQMICRSCRVLVFNTSGDLLVQRRGVDVIRPCLLDHSAAGHVDEGETYEAAAYRELEEELGIQGVPLTTIEISVPSDHFFSGVFKVTIADDLALQPGHEEVDALQWYTITELEAELATNPDHFTPEFVQTWSLFRDKILS